MSSTEEMQAQFEQFLNEQRADISIVQVTLQVLILDILQHQKNPAGLLVDLKANAKSALEHMLSNNRPLPPFAQERFAQFFQAMEEAVLKFQTKVGPSSERH